MISTMNQITNFPITCERGNSNRIRLPQRVADSCTVLRTVVNIHGVRSHGRSTQRWTTSAVHDIVRFRYQGMNVTILYSKG